MNREELTKKWFGNIYFDEESHTYTDDYNTTYSSVTKYIGEFFPKFKQEEQAKAYGERLARKGIIKTTEQILQEWDDKRDFGRDIHNRIEVLLSNPEYVPTDEFLEGEHPLVRNALRVVRGLKSLYNIKYVYPEVRVFNKDLRLAGTIDLLMITHDDKIVLGDFKTSNTIYKGNKQHDTHELTKHLPNNNYTKYSLQLNAYSSLLPREYEVVKSFIVHLLPNDYSKTTLYPIGNYSEVINSLFDLRKGGGE